MYSFVVGSSTVFFPSFFHIYKTRLLESEVGGKEFDIIPSEAAVE